MNDDFDRDGLIDLLNNLNSDDEQVILKTVTALKAGMKASGKTWDDLIANAPPDSYEADADEDDVVEIDDEVEDEDDDDAIEAAPVEDAGDNEESLKIIEKMLSKFQLSAQMREELQGYKEDIAEGEFDARDRQYLKALHARLSKSQ
ncbi:MAG: hypothetical protein WD407_14460 [Rhodospirillales bacterium]